MSRPLKLHKAAPKPRGKRTKGPVLPPGAVPFGSLGVGDYLRLRPDGPVLSKGGRGCAHNRDVFVRCCSVTVAYPATVDGYTNCATRDLALQGMRHVAN